MKLLCKIRDKFETGGFALLMSSLLLLGILIFVLCTAERREPEFVCSYCGETIDTRNDDFLMSGTKEEFWHADCYLKEMEEKNGK